MLLFFFSFLFLPVLVYKFNNFLPVFSAEIVGTFSQMISDSSLVVGVACLWQSVLADKARKAEAFVILSDSNAVQHLVVGICPGVFNGACNIQISRCNAGGEKMLIEGTRCVFFFNRTRELRSYHKKLQKKYLNDELLYMGHTLTNEKPNYQIVELITC